jgi:ribulose-5-phosphate 4-epimerase/fuculose-1-phosphate aldolase
MRGLCAVEEYDLRENRVRSAGSVLPSSESLTHGAIYDLSTAIRFVFHVHSPAIWTRARELRLPQTSADIAYGTQAMAVEVQDLYRSTNLAERRVLSMRGHEDGVVAFGHTAREAGLAIMAELAAAYALG